MDEIEDLFEPENNDDSQAPLSSQHDETQIEVLHSDAIATFEEHADAVYFVDVYVGQDGDPIFVSGDKGEQAIVWQVQKDEEEKDESIIKWTAKEVARLQGHTETVEFSRFDSSGKFVATCGMNNQVRVWEVAQNYGLKWLVQDIPQEDMNFLEWHPSAPLFLVGGNDYMIWMVNALSGKVVRNFIGHEEKVIFARFSIFDSGK